MASQPGSSANDGEQNQPEETFQETIPTLGPATPLRNIFGVAQRRLTRAFARAENIDVPGIPDAGQPVVQHQPEAENSHITHVETPVRSGSMDADDDIQPSTRPGTEGRSLHQVSDRAPSSTTPPLGEGSDRTDPDPFRRIDGETATQMVQREVDNVLDRLRDSREQPNVQPNVRPATNQGTLTDRPAALETSTNRSLPSMLAILENIQTRLDGLEAGAARSDQDTHRRHEEAPNAGRGTNEEYTDQSDYEEEDHNANARMKKTQAGTSRAHQKKGQITASYYSRTRSRKADRHPKKNIGYDSDSSSEDDYNDHRYVTGHEDTSPVVNIVPFHSRPVGPPNIGLRSIKPANKKFDRLISYRSYRLRLTTDQRSSRDTAEVRVHIKNLNLTMKSHIFDGNDPIKIFDFLTRFVNEADMLNMSEAQAFIALPTFLADPAETQFRTTLSGASRRGGVTCWPEAVQYLLRTYATAFAMREVLADLRNIKQNANESEESYRKRLNEAIFRCGNVHTEDEKMTLYVDGLSETIRMVVARYRETIHRRDLTFEELCHYAKSEDDAYRARFKHVASILPSGSNRTRTRNAGGQLNLMQGGADEDPNQGTDVQPTTADDSEDQKSA